MTNDSFPKFQLIQLQNKEIIQSYTQKFPPYSDFNFTSLWCYNTNSDTSFCWLNGNLVIKLRDYINNEFLLSFLGNSDLTSTINQLFEYLNSHNLNPSLSLIPEDSIKILLHEVKSGLNIQEDLNSNDYIIPLKESAELKNINSHKIESFNKFITNNPNYSIQTIDLTKYSIQKQVLDVFSTWAQQKNKSSQDVKNELTATQKLLENSAQFNLFSLGLFINEEMIGFIIDERVHSQFVIGHFIKANFDYSGAYEVMNQVSAQFHYEAGYKYINIEQDLGIKGLRISKMQRSPVFFLKKYTISKS